ncbi:hypothetical protein [Ostreibacterium oceani]|uniref:Uncharacterized protein n=1 Tax=Ostreibacterium oceani TaxID=2654998 RepID=A0A6N7EWP5_9GAMM|nr:hypothetical protein [Ostreibacterium oceani]MPV85839.1 hypothetical protein [Ostreibacterium oceani]
MITESINLSKLRTLIDALKNANMQIKTLEKSLAEAEKKRDDANQTAKNTQSEYEAKITSLTQANQQAIDKLTATYEAKISQLAEENAAELANLQQTLAETHQHEMDELTSINHELSAKSEQLTYSNQQMINRIRGIES